MSKKQMIDALRIWRDNGKLDSWCYENSWRYHISGCGFGLQVLVDVRLLDGSFFKTYDINCFGICLIKDLYESARDFVGYDNNLFH